MDDINAQAIIPGPFADLFSGAAATGNIPVDAATFLRYHGLPHTSDHCARVAQEAVLLARRFGAQPDQAQTAGWLHDISAVYPNSVRVKVARSAGIRVLPEEEQAPMILHQKLSAAMARALFSVTDQEILGAIRVHTTLRPDATLLDKVVFVADKIAWDQKGSPPYLNGLLDALDISLDRAVFQYLGHLWQRRHQLLVIHPWFAAAYHDMRAQTETTGA